MHCLKFPRDEFDEYNNFTFAFAGRRDEQIRTGYLFKSPKSGEIYIMQTSMVIKDSYTEMDREVLARLNAMTPVRSGDAVEVDGVKYAAIIRGDFSDAGCLIKL